MPGSLTKCSTDLVSQVEPQILGNLVTSGGTSLARPFLHAELVFLKSTPLTPPELSSLLLTTLSRPKPLPTNSEGQFLERQAPFPGVPYLDSSMFLFSSPIANYQFLFRNILNQRKLQFESVATKTKICILDSMYRTSIS